MICELLKVIQLKSFKTRNLLQLGETEWIVRVVDGLYAWISEFREDDKVVNTQQVEVKYLYVVS